MPDGDAKNGMERGIDQLPFLVARSQTWSLCRGRFACSTKNPKKLKFNLRLSTNKPSEEDQIGDVGFSPFSSNFRRAFEPLGHKTNPIRS